MEITYALTPDDLIAFEQYQRYQQPSTSGYFRRRFWLIALAVLLIAAAVCWLTDLFRGSWSIASAIVLYVALLVLFVYLLRYFAVYLLRSLFAYLFRRSFVDLARQLPIGHPMRRMLKGGQSIDELLFSQRLTITPESLQIERGISSMAMTSMTILWTAIEKIAVSKNHALFYVAATPAHILPKRAFASKREFEEFVRTAQQYHEAAIRSKSGP